MSPDLLVSVAADVANQDRTGELERDVEAREHAP